jgi:chaperone BCS1
LEQEQIIMPSEAFNPSPKLPAVMAPLNSNTTNLAVIDQPIEGSSSRIRYVDKDEPLDSPGIVPAHLKRGVTVQHPLLEILQRLVHRLQPGTNLEIVLAAIALYKAGQPVYEFLKRMLGQLLTSQVTVSEFE